MSEPRPRVSSSSLAAYMARCAAAPTAFFAGAVVPRIRSGGTLQTERSREWPGDALVPDPSLVWTNAMTIDRPAALVWPWVTQLGQGRAGLYSYDWLENAVRADVHSADRVRPGLQQWLKVGDRVIRMARYAPYNPVALYQPGHALVLGGIRDTDEQLEAGHPTSTWAFILEPMNDHQCRLIIRSRTRGFGARLQGPVQFVMQRKMMLGIKQRAEGTWSPSIADVAVPMSWFAAATVAAVHSVGALRSGRRDQAALAALAAIAAQLLMFWDIPTPARTALIGALAGSTVPPLLGPR